VATVGDKRPADFHSLPGVLFCEERMIPDEIEPETKQTWRDKIQLGASEWMYLLGLLLLFSGLWVWLSLGMALTVAGAVLVLSSTLNSTLRDLPFRGGA
jgi:hypothetical protein